MERLVGREGTLPSREPWDIVVARPDLWEGLEVRHGFSGGSGRAVFLGRCMPQKARLQKGDLIGVAKCGWSSEHKYQSL